MTFKTRIKNNNYWLFKFQNKTDNNFEFNANKFHPLTQTFHVLYSYCFFYCHHPQFKFNVLSYPNGLLPNQNHYFQGNLKT